MLLLQFCNAPHVAPVRRFRSSIVDLPQSRNASFAIPALRDFAKDQGLSTPFFAARVTIGSGISTFFGVGTLPVFWNTFL